MKKITIIILCIIICFNNVATAETSKELLEIVEKIDAAGIFNLSFDLGAKCALKLNAVMMVQEKLGIEIDKDAAVRQMGECRAKARDEVALKIWKHASKPEK